MTTDELLEFRSKRLIERAKKLPQPLIFGLPAERWSRNVIEAALAVSLDAQLDLRRQLDRSLDFVAGDGL